MVRLYRAELTLLQHQRRRIPLSTNLPTTPTAATATTSIVDETESQQPSTKKVNANNVRGLRSSTLRSSFLGMQDFEEAILPINNAALSMEGGSSNGTAELPGISDEIYRLLPVVSGVEFLQVTLNSSCWNQDRSIQSTSFRLNGSFLIPNEKLLQSNDNRKEKFSVCLDLEQLQASDDPMSSSSSSSFLDMNSGCRIVRLWNCLIGNHNDSNQLDNTVLWTQEELNPFTNTIHNKDDDNYPSTTNNFPIWLRNAQQFVEFAHGRASSVQKWQHTYPALFGAVTTDDDKSASTIPSLKVARTNRPDCLHLWIPTRRRPAIHSSSRTKVSSQAAPASSSTFADSTAPTAFIVQWSWCAHRGKDFVEVLSDMSPLNHHHQQQRGVVEQKRLGSMQQRKQGEKQKRPIGTTTTSTTIPRQMQEGLQHLVQYNGGDCRQALQMLLETLAKKHEPF